MSQPASRPRRWPDGGGGAGCPCPTSRDLTLAPASCHFLDIQEQNRILATLSSPHAIARVQKLLAAADPASRTEMGRRICRLFVFQNSRGQLQIAGCMHALRSLEAAAASACPPPVTSGGGVWAAVSEIVSTHFAVPPALSAQ